MKRYNDYASYLKNRFGSKVYRIGLDAGFTCPNRDGTKGTDGCIYCNDAGARASYANPSESVTIQLSKHIDRLKRTKHADAFIAYFQAFTNTYAGIDRLKTTYDAILAFPEIVGLSIGTRPDAIDDEKLALIASYADRYDTWIEYGLQSSHDRTLHAINRGHTFADFTHAVALTRKYPIRITAHVIIGLPGETRDDIIATADRLAELKIDGVKIHLFHILKGSWAEKLYQEGNIKILAQNEYISLVCDFLEHLPTTVVIQRLTGEGSKETHIAPIWALDKIATINKINAELARRGTQQGNRTSVTS